VEQDLQTPTRPLPLDIIQEPKNPVRSTMAETDFFALCESMRAIGQLSPIIVKPVGEQYEVVAGHRRLRAARYLRWPTIMASIIAGDAMHAEACKSHENSFREPIQPEDEGRYFDWLARERKMGIKEIAKFCNRSHYYVESRLTCLLWPPDIRDALKNDVIGLGVAEALSTITDDAERTRLIGYAKEHGVSARTARAWADSWQSTRLAIDPERLAAIVAGMPQKYEEPMFPCYGCEKPIYISQLRTLRLCGECNDDLQRERNTNTNTGILPAGPQRTAATAPLPAGTP